MLGEGVPVVAEVGAAAFEGGGAGGTVVACGTPEQVAACPESYTGQYLKKLL